MKKLLLMVLVVSMMSGCALLSLDDDVVVPAVWPVSQVNEGYVPSVTFTGDPASDFGAAKVIDDKLGSDQIFEDGSKYRDIANVYIGYSLFYLYVAVEGGSIGMGQNDMGRVVVMIDNGLTNAEAGNGITNASYSVGSFTKPSSGDSMALDGSRSGYGWDTIGVALTGSAQSNRKISCYVQHWRPMGDDVAFYKTYTSPINNRKISGSAFIHYPNEGTDAGNVSEFALSWVDIFGTTNTNVIPENIYISVKIDSGIAPSPTGVDVCPDDAGDGDGNVLSSTNEWIKIPLL